MQKLIALLLSISALLTPYAIASTDKPSSEDIKLINGIAKSYFLKREGIPRKYRSALYGFQKKLYKIYNAQADDMDQIICRKKKDSLSKGFYRQSSKRLCTTRMIHKESSNSRLCRSSGHLSSSMQENHDCSTNNKKLTIEKKQKMKKQIIKVAKKIRHLLLNDSEAQALLEKYKDKLMPLVVQG